MMQWAPGETVSVTVNDRDSLLKDMGARFDHKAGFTVATLNLDHVVKLRRDADFRSAYAKQTHVTADGNPIVWLSRLSGQSEVTLVPGSELIDPVAELAAKKGVSIALFGATDVSLSVAALALEKRHENLRIVSKRSPSMDFDPEGAEARDAVAAIKESGARLVFLALGAPKQERFAAFAHQLLPEVGFLSIGAGLDFISGSQKRAPVWARRLAVEWVWRMLGNPSRLAGRYAACIMVMPSLTIQALSHRRQGS